MELVKMKYTIKLYNEVDGRIIADIKDMPGVMVYGKTPKKAVRKVIVLALRVLADQIEHNETKLETELSFKVKNRLDKSKKIKK
jgi:predicted RNase H-like HicB family nuclease